MESFISPSSEEKIDNDLSNHLAVDEVGSPTSKERKKTRSSRLSKESRRSEISEEEGSNLSEDEVKYLIVSDISTEIVRAALDLIYENYLEKQTVYFVSHCSRLAWKALVEWNFQQKDKGGYREADVDQLDMEPLPSPKDSWAGHSVPIGLESPRRLRFTDIEAQTEDGHSTPNVSMTSGHGSRRTTLSQSSVILRTSKPQFHFKPKFVEKTIKETKVKKSDDVAIRTEGKIARLDEGKKDTYELPSPVPLQTKHFPSARVEVQYAIMPGNPSKGTNLASKNELKTKTIVLKKPAEDDGKNRAKTKFA